MKQQELNFSATKVAMVQKNMYTQVVVKSNGAGYDYICLFDKLLVGQLLTLEGHSRPYFVTAEINPGRYTISPMQQEDEIMDAIEEDEHDHTFDNTYIMICKVCGTQRDSSIGSCPNPLCGIISKEEV